MSRMKVRFYLLVSAIFVISGCGKNSQTVTEKAGAAVFDAPCYDWSDEKQDTITIWARDHELDRIYMQRAFSRYKELTGSEVEIVVFPQTEFDEAVAEVLNEGGEGPDVLLTYGGTNIEPFHPDKNFYDFSQAPWVGDLTSTSINQTIYHGKVIGLPHWEASISGTLYNKALFKRLGIPVPQTQEEFLEVCQTLKEHGITPVYMPCKEISMMLYQFPMDSIMKDSGILSGLNEGRLSYSDIPQMRTIVEWYKTMADSGYLGDNYLEHDWSGINDALKSGRYGMMLCWDTWLYTDYTGDASEFGLMPAFMGVPEQGTFEGPNLGLLVVNRNSAHLDAAINLITFMADPYNYNVAFEGIYTAPVFKNQATSISTPQYVESERLIEKNYRDSTAWLRVKGFSQMDAVCILTYMEAKPGYTIKDCLDEMDKLRTNRIFYDADGKGGD